MPHDQDSNSLGEQTKVNLGDTVRIFGFGARVFASLCVMAVGGAGALWVERATRREADQDLTKYVDDELRKQKDAILERVATTYVKEESLNYRAKQLSDELQKAIDRLNTELSYLRRDVTSIGDTVKEIPAISAQLKVLQERK